MSVFTVSQEVPVATTDAGEDTGTLERRRLVQAVQVQTGGVRGARRRRHVVLVRLDVEAFAARQGRPVGAFRFRGRLKGAVRGGHFGRRRHRVLDRHVDQATVLAGFAVSADVRVVLVVASPAARRRGRRGGCLRARRLPRVQVPRQSLRGPEVLLPLVIAGRQSAGGLTKPAERAGGNAETRWFFR